MAVAFDSPDVEPGGGSPSFAGDIARLTDTISVCERLCLLGARSIIACAMPADGRPDQAAVFIPSVSRGIPIQHSEEPHRTTSAQCVAALQSILPVIGRFRLDTRESKDLAFHPIERESMKVFEPQRLESRIRGVVDRGLIGLHGIVPSAGDIAVPDGDKVRSILDSEVFGYLHPFTAANILRAIAPSQGIYGEVWWKSLFIVLWFLNRRGSSRRGYPNIQTTNSPGTAFLTGKCVDAVSKVLNVFGRRRDRFRKLIGLMRQLDEVRTHGECIAEMARNDPPLLNGELFGQGPDYRKRILAPQVRWCIEELALDGTLPETYRAWEDELKKATESQPKTAEAKKKQPPNDYCTCVVDSFRAAMQCDKVRREHARLRQAADAAVTEAKETFRTVDDIHRRIVSRLAPEAAPGARLDAGVLHLDGVRGTLPSWLCSEEYWEYTKRVVRDTSEIDTAHESRLFLETLESHWRRHRDAADNALKTTTLFKTYLDGILDAFRDADAHLAGNAGKTGAGDSPADADGKVREFVRVFTHATEHVSVLRGHLSKDVEIGARWAAILMNRHLRFAASGALAEFDAGELAHALRVVCLSDRKIDFDTILTVLRTICAAQRPDGTWICHQPFFWTKTGLAAATLSVETAGAVVATVNTILRNSERYGVSLEGSSDKLHAVYLSLDRFFHWLSANLQSIRTPAWLESRGGADAGGPGRADGSASAGDGGSPGEPPLYGWCSDRVIEDGRIHSWVTASAIEFLAEYRRLAQERINSHLRAELLSYHPDQLLKTLSDVSPTDVGNVGIESMTRIHVADPVVDQHAPVILQLLHLLHGHKRLELKEGSWLPAKLQADNSFWSAIFYGPPGTSKTFLANAIAGELKWPLISLSPADFLTKGAGSIEARASEIFEALGSGSRLVYFFDEIDELIRDRRQADTERTDAFSFLTPSFLTKLQDFRKNAKIKEFIFILATNYYDRIDPAAKRSGRIDREFVIVYPDRESRAALLLDHLMKNGGSGAGPDGKSSKLNEVADFLKQANQLATEGERADPASADDPDAAPRSFADICATFTGSLSYQKIQDLLSARLGNASTRDSDIDKLMTELIEISEGTSSRYKPEIRLEHYSRRPGAVDEITAVAKVYSKHLFPTHYKNMEWHAVHLVQREIERLKTQLDGQKDKDFCNALDKLVEDLNLVGPRGRSRAPQPG